MVVGYNKSKNSTQIDHLIFTRGNSFIFEINNLFAYALII